MPRFLRAAYRKEPISSFILTVGAVDAVIGGVGDRWSLLTFGVGMAGVAIALRLWKVRQERERPVEVPEQAPVLYLPSQSSRTQLPPLTISRKRRPK